MAAALVQGKTWRMFFIRHRQCSVYSLKLSDSCLSWTQEGPPVIASSTLTVRHFWLNQKPWWMSVKSCANEVTLSRGWKVFLPTERPMAENLPGLPSQWQGPILHRWSSGGAAAGSSTPSVFDGDCCSTASDYVKKQNMHLLAWCWTFHVWFDQFYSTINTHIMACWRGERSVCTAWWVSTVHAGGQTCPFQL